MSTTYLLMHHITWRVFWQRIKSRRWLSPAYSPNLAPCDFWLFPKLKPSLKGRDITPLIRFRRIWLGHWWQLGELCEVSRCLLWRRLRCHCPTYNVSCIFFNEWLYFSYYVSGYLLYKPHMYRVNRQSIKYWLNLEFVMFFEPKKIFEVWSFC